MKQWTLMLVFSLLTLFQLSAELTLQEVAAGKPFGSSSSRRRPMAAGVYDQTVNRTFATWGGYDMDPVVVQMEHPSGKITGPVTVGEIPGKADVWAYHNYPHMLQADDGHLLVFYANHNKTMYMSRSGRPRTVEGKWTQTAMDLKGENPGYPLPVKAKNGDIYVFYRHTISGVNRPLHFVRSTDNGLSWEDPQPIIKHDPLRDDRMDEIYAGGIGFDPVRNRFVLNWTLAGGSLGHNQAHANVYMAYYDANTKKCFSPGGVDLGEVIDNEESMAHCLVHQRKGTGYVTGHYGASDFTGEGDGLILYTILQSGGYTVFSATWRNGSFHKVPVGSTGSSNYADAVCGLEKVGPMAFRAYFMRADKKNDRLYHIQAMRTRDGGLSWEEDNFFDFEAPVNQFQVISNAHPQFKALVVELDWKRVYNADKRVWILGTDGKRGVRFSSPQNQATFAEGQAIPLQVLTAGNVKSVDFYAGTRKLAEVDRPPFQYFWANPPPGPHNVTARVTGSDGWQSFAYARQIRSGNALFHDTFQDSAGKWQILSQGTSPGKGSPYMEWGDNASGGFSGHDGVIRCISPHFDEVSTQRAILFRPISPADLRNASWSTTGIVANAETEVRLAVRFDKGWGVTASSVKTASSPAKPSAGGGEFAAYTWHLLNEDLSVGDVLPADVVLGHATAVGVWGRKTGTYMKHHLHQVDSFMVNNPPSE